MVQNAEILNDFDRQMEEEEIRCECRLERVFRSWRCAKKPSLTGERKGRKGKKIRSGKRRKGELSKLARLRFRCRHKSMKRGLLGFTTLVHVTSKGCNKMPRIFHFGVGGSSLFIDCLFPPPPPASTRASLSSSLSIFRSQVATFALNDDDGSCCCSSSVINRREAAYLGEVICRKTQSFFIWHFQASFSFPQGSVFFQLLRG